MRKENLNSKITVTCLGQAYNVLPKKYWHLAHPTAGALLHNVPLHEGLCFSISTVNRMPNLENAVSEYAIKVMTDEKEGVWERVRTDEFPDLPSRKGAVFLLDDIELAKQVRGTWFEGQERHLLEAHIIYGSRLHRADSGWLDCIPENWEEYARRYWHGDMNENAIPEVLVDGAVYFPAWDKPPFGLFAGMLQS
jgi:hypothetical protein